MYAHILVTVDDTITQCTCCGKRNLKRTIKLASEEIGEFYIGVICVGRWFSLNMTGNVYYAANKLENYIKTLEDDELEEIIENIKEASSEW